MPRKTSKRELEETTLLDALRGLEEAAVDEAGMATVKKGLGSPSARVVAKAARLVAEHELESLVADLAPAYRRFLAHPVKTDPGCVAKQAVVEALVRLDRDPADVLLEAVRYEQPEPGWNETIDTAAHLRGHAALGLANLGHPAAATEIARLLADREWVTRAGAARALGSIQPAISEPLLRFKVLAGDKDPRVLGECFSALLRAAPSSSFDFVAGFLGASEAIAEQAAIALGESRTPAALSRLVAWRETLAGSSLDRVALLAIAFVRTDESLAHLVAVLRDGDRKTALRAAEALGIFRHDARVREVVLVAARSRRDKAVLEKLGELWSPGRDDPGSG